MKGLKAMPLIVAMASTGLLTPVVTLAASTPQGTAYDVRVKTVTYNQDDIVTVHVRKGTSTLIQLQPGERVQSSEGGLGIGDSDAWTIGVRGNNIFLKPKAVSPDTNITLVTDRRTYAFALRSVSRDASAAYIVRFRYPDVEAREREKALVAEKVKSKQQRLACTNLPDPSAPNISYQMWGSTSLAPSAMWDDGQTTCLRYPHSTDLPAIYRVTGDGSEQLTNMSVHGDIVMIHGVSREYRLRDGTQVLGIKTDNITVSPFNARNTTSPDLTREVKSHDE